MLEKPGGASDVALILLVVVALVAATLLCGEGPDPVTPTPTPSPISTATPTATPITPEGGRNVHPCREGKAAQAVYWV